MTRWISANTPSIRKAVKPLPALPHGDGGALIWFDVEDVVRHFDSAAQPTGIPRVCLEFLSAAQRLYPNRVRLCRQIRHSGRLEAVSFAQLFAACSSAAEPWRTDAPGIFVRQKIRRGLRYLWRTGKRWLTDRIPTIGDSSGFRRGDVLVCLGSPWRNAHYADQVRAAKEIHGLHFALFLHDILPFTHPQFVDESFLRIFRPWLAQTLPLADVVLTSSNYNRDAIRTLCQRQGWPLASLRTLTLGSGISVSRSDGPERPSWPEPYVLLVSTLEIRKNHRLMFTVWRRLIERHGPTAVPTLIFAGRQGWRVDDVMHDLAQSHRLDGKIVLAQGLSDSALAYAYRGALFTVFPSFCEGWGLPVAESLSSGTLCIASNTTSIPEVGGDLADYFDPADADAATAAVERALFDSDYLAERRRQIAKRFRPTSWEDCVSSFIAQVDAALVSTTGRES